MAEDLRRFLDDEPIRPAGRRRPSGTPAGRGTIRQSRCWARVLMAVLVLTTLASLIVARNMARLAENQREAARAERWARLEADQARDVAKQAQHASSRQAAGLLLDRGIEDARGGEPARALHLFVQALRALPDDDPQAAAARTDDPGEPVRLGRDRAGPGAHLAGRAPIRPESPTLPTAK